MGVGASTESKQEEDSGKLRPVTINQCQFLKGHTDVVRSLKQIDALRFASASDDGLVLIWSHSTGQLLQVLEGHRAAVLSMHVLDQNFMVTGSADHSLKIWDLNSGKCLATLLVHQGPVQAIIAGINGGFISAGGCGFVALWSKHGVLESTINVNDTSYRSRRTSRAQARQQSTPKRGTHASTLIKKERYDSTSSTTSTSIVRLASMEESNPQTPPNQVYSPVQSGLNDPPHSNSKSNSSKSTSISSPLSMSHPNLSRFGDHSHTAQNNLFLSGGHEKRSAYDIDHLLLLKNEKQLVCGCVEGTLIFINLAHYNRCVFVRKHQHKITYIQQLTADRMVSVSIDGLICFWRVDPYKPLCLTRINDQDQEKLVDPKLKRNIHSNTPTLDILSVVKLGTGDFVAGVGGNLVLFDSLFNVRMAVRQAHSDSIIGMAAIKQDSVLVTASNDRTIRMWNLNAITNHQRPPIRLPKLMVLFEPTKKGKRHRNNAVSPNKPTTSGSSKSILGGVFGGGSASSTHSNTNPKREPNRASKTASLTAFSSAASLATESNIAHYSCDPDGISLGTFRIHSCPITYVISLNNASFVSCDHKNQIILWKDACLVSEFQNRVIREHFLMYS